MKDYGVDSQFVRYYHSMGYVKMQGSFMYLNIHM